MCSRLVYLCEKTMQLSESDSSLSLLSGFGKLTASTELHRASMHKAFVQCVYVKEQNKKVDDSALIKCQDARAGSAHRMHAVIERIDCRALMIYINVNLIV